MFTNMTKQQSQTEKVSRTLSHLEIENILADKIAKKC